ncbi:MAG: PKD domain-containing protein [Bacteroidetes bacterium]|nr:PKD domain-containing protein [Bacteroidota bacterium]
MRKANTLILIITLISSSCTKPTNACFTYTADTLAINTPITFNSGCSQNASYFLWNFVDNTLDTTTTNINITHAFSKSGLYLITLEAKRKDGASSGKDNYYTQKTIIVQ